MTELCWMNGQVMPLEQARVGVEDRGFQFADGVYEAVRIYNGVPFELHAHLDRLERSCGGIELPMPVAKPKLTGEIMSLVQRSGGREAWLYLQVTRGPAPRSHLFPQNPRPTVLFYVRSMPPMPGVGEGLGYRLLSVPDERWGRCWIKSIALLANVLAKNAAAKAGADEAVFIHNGVVTEGSSSNLFALIGGKLVTHPLGPRILPGVTRDVLLDCARELGIGVEERAMKLQEAQSADEVFVTSSTRELVWVTQWDRAKIGDGSCGPTTRKLHEAYRARVQQSTRG